MRSLARIALLDDSYLTREFTGGGSVNAVEVIDRLASEFELIYLPKVRVLQNVNSDRISRLERNIKVIEIKGIQVSETFKKLLYLVKNQNITSLSQIRDIMISGYINELSETDLVFDNDYSPSLYPSPMFKGEILDIARLSRVKEVGLVFRGFSCINRSNRLGLLKLLILLEPRAMTRMKGISRLLSHLLHPEFDLFLINSIIKLKKLKFLGIVDPSVIARFPQLRKLNNKVHRLYPGDASRFGIQTNTVPKADYAIFYARLVPEKGILEIPLILKELKENFNRTMELHVAGVFSNDCDKHAFNNLIRKCQVGANVKILGFISEDALKIELERAKVMIYPSHSDSYSIAIIEALSMRTKVIAYDIPALRELYGEIDAVRLVKEYDFRSIAKEVMKQIQSPESEYFRSFEKAEFREFMTVHSSYEYLKPHTIAISDQPEFRRLCFSDL